MIYEQRIGEVTIMKVSDIIDIDVPKKRKICDPFHLKSHNGVADTPPGILVSPAVSSTAGSSTSCCSMNGSSYSKFLDLDNGVEVTEKEKMSSPNERQEESKKQELKKMPENESPPCRIREKLPSIEELEAFFAKHEKEIHKRFREKYNFDFEKEEPLEGCYKWVQIHKN